MTQPESSRAHPVRLAAHLLLVAAVFIYALGLWLPPDPTFRPLILAFSEAAMVGGLADWFAVTALFRHPLGIPLPHTAILPANKDRIAQNFGSFMQKNFLAKPLLEQRLSRVDFSSFIFGWLSRRENSTDVVRKGFAILRPVIETISDANIHRAIVKGLRKVFEGVEVAPYMGKAIQFIFEGERAQKVTDELFRALGQLIEDSRPLIRKRVREKSPWFIPDFIDNQIYEKLVEELRSFFTDVIADQRHPFRAKFTSKMIEFAHRLESDPAYRELGEAVKRDLLSSENLRDIIGGILKDLRVMVGERLSQNNDPLIGVMADVIGDIADEIKRNEQLRENINDWIRVGIAAFNEQYSEKAAQFISETVRNWDTSTLVSKFEDEIGRDLQFIRINGTLVGGFIGVLIYLMELYFT